MSEDQTALYAGIIALVIVSLIIMAACIVCKICVNSKKVQRWSGLDNLFAKLSATNEDRHIEYDKETDLTLRMQPGEYVGYEATERNITITPLPPSVSKEGLHYDNPEDNSEQVADKLDMSQLKSAHSVPHKSKSYSERTNHHNFHNSYTIYEETSDFSGNESGAKSVSSLRSLGSTKGLKTSSESSLTHSESDQSLGVSLELLELHSNDSGLGQVEYSLQYQSDVGQLVLHIIQAKDLDIESNANGSLPDTFIKTFASDFHDCDPKKQTKLSKATANPIFKEKFIFSVDPGELATASITLQIFTRDHYARQKLVGEICVQLSPLLVTDTYRTWSNILDYDHQPTSSCADINVSLEYDGTRKELTVDFQELQALKLQPSPLYKSKALYIEGTLVDIEDLMVKKRTSIFSVATESSHVILEQQPLIFNLDNTNLQKNKLLVELCEELPDNSHHTIGYTILGSGATDVECGHWLLLENTNVKQPLVMWHHIHHTPTPAKPSVRFNLR